jgi:hypothetical protein
MDALKGYNEQVLVQFFLLDAAQSIPVPSKECKGWEKHPMGRWLVRAEARD